MAQPKSLLNQLKDKTQLRHWSEDELKALDRKFLTYVATWNGASTVVPKGWTEAFGDKQISVQDSAVALQMISKSTMRTVAHYRPETYLNTNGGNMLYTPTKAVMMNLAGEQKERANAVIPAPFGEVDNYPNIQQVASFCSQIVQNKAGSWVANVNSTVWLKTLQRSQVQVEGLIKIAQTVCTILNENATWKTMTQLQKNGVSGIDVMLFVRSAIDKVDREVYDLLNTKIVNDFFAPFTQENGEWCVKETDEGKPVIPESVYEVCEDNEDSVDVVQEMGYPTVCHYKGGFIPQPAFPQNLGTIKSCKERHQRMAELLGSGDAPSAILAGMKDFSGITDEFGKRIQFQLGATFYLWSIGRPVDVALSTVGDLPMLVSSCNHWRKRFEEDLKLKEAERRYNLPFKTTDVRFILPQVTDINKVHLNLHSMVVVVPRENSVIVAYHGGHLPTSGTKNTQVDYEYNATKLYPEFWQTNDIIIYSIIYGKVCFSGRREEGEDKLSVELNPQKPFKKPTYVYRHGTTANWCGVLSTLPSVAVAGYGAQNVGTTDRPVWDESKPGFSLTYLTEYRSPIKWYTKIGEDVVIQCMAWFNPVSRYHPISNLPFISRAGVSLVAAFIEAESGEIIGNTVAVTARAQRAGKRLMVKGSLATKKPEERIGVPGNSSNSSMVQQDTNYVLQKKRVPIGGKRKPPVVNAPMMREEEPPEESEEPQEDIDPPEALDPSDY